MIRFKVNKHEAHLIRRIAARASAMVKRLGVDYPTLEIEMDITAAHRNGCPLHLTSLLGASNFNFAHDVLGIRQHIDRGNGNLVGCFVPRYSVKL